MTLLTGALLVATMILSHLVFMLVKRQHQTHEDLTLLLESVHMLCVHTGLAETLEERPPPQGDPYG